MDADESWDADDYQIPAVKKVAELPVTIATPLLEGQGISLVQPAGAGKEDTVSVQIGKPASRKQRLKAALKMAESKSGVQSREDKVAALQELMGAPHKQTAPAASRHEWLDPHCNESDFERENLS